MNRYFYSIYTIRYYATILHINRSLYPYNIKTHIETQDTLLTPIHFRAGNWCYFAVICQFAVIFLTYRALPVAIVQRMRFFGSSSGGGREEIYAYLYVKY